MKIKFVEPGEKVRINEKGKKVFGEKIDNNKELTVKKVLDTLFNGILIYQIVELEESPFKEGLPVRQFATSWFDIPFEFISVEEVMEKMPELIKELERVNKIVEEATEEVRKEKMSNKGKQSAPIFFRARQLFASWKKPKSAPEGALLG